MTKEEVNKVYTAGEMWENGIQVYIKDYKKRLLTVFPDVTKIKEIDASYNDWGETDPQINKIQISTENFRKNEEMPYKYKSHIMRMSKDDIFYFRLQPNLPNFRKFVVLNPNPEDALFLYIKHMNLKQYLSGNNIWIICFQ